MTEPPLPAPFADLAPHLDWALEPERARTAKKVASSMEEINAFYDAAMPRTEEILAYLEGFAGDAMPAPAHRLYLLTLLAGGGRQPGGNLYSSGEGRDVLVLTRLDRGAQP